MKFKDILNLFGRGEVGISAPAQTPVTVNDLYPVATNYKDPVSGFVIPYPTNLRQYKIDEWKKAIAAATRHDDPDRTLLYDIYDYIMFDLHVSTLFESRVLPVKRAAFKIMNIKSKENNEELMTVPDSNWFEDFIEFAIASKFYGYSLIELTDVMDADAYITLIPRQHVDPVKELIFIERGDTKGYSYTEQLRPYYIGVGKSKDLGYLMKITPVILAKKYALAQWNEFNEKCVIPFRVVKTPSRDKKRHQLLGQILQMMGSAGWGVLNDDETLELIQLNDKDAYKAFATLINWLDDSVTRFILGQTATTKQDSTGTYGSLQILEDIADDRHQSDKVFVRRLINNELLPRLTLFGFNFDGHIFVWDNTIELTTDQKIDIINKINLNYVVDPKYVTEQTGIPIVGTKNTVTAVENTAVKKKIDNLSIFQAIRNFYNDATATDNHTVDINNMVNDADTDRILELVHQGKLTEGMIDAQSYMRVANSLFAQVTKGFDTTLKKIDYNHTNANMLQFMRGNIFKFSAAKNEKQLREISALLIDENGKIKPYHQFKNEATEVYKKYNLNWLKTEHTTALAQAQSASVWADAMKTKDLYDLQYETAGDERVRAEHKSYNGITLPADDPWWEKHLPPNGWSCRCRTRKVAKGTKQTPVEKLRGLPKPETGFAYNAGAKKLIFDNTHPYFADLDTDKLTAVKNYGMKPVEDIYKRTDKMPERGEEWDLDTFKKEWQKKADEQNLADHKNGFIIESVLGDKLLFDSKLYGKMVGKKATEQRWKIASNLDDILKKPDEVWQTESVYKGKKSNILSYVKYYKDKAITVVSNIEGDEIIRVSSFYEINKLNDTGHLGNLRMGTLLYRK
jgi:SPP1 gp7 family putative phage head morphogenesis protein